MDLTPPNNAVDNRWIWGQIMCNIISRNQYQIMKSVFDIVVVLIYGAQLTR